MPPIGTRHGIHAAAACLLLASGWDIRAADAATFNVETPDGSVAVDSITMGADGPHPAVIVLSGSKGFGSPAYPAMSREFNRLGLDVFELHVLSTVDLDAIARAGKARERITYYATRMPSWTAAVRATVNRLAADPHHADRVGLLAISLGAEIATKAIADNGGARALVLVDGGYPGEQAPSLGRLPQVRLIWGGEDRTFPVATARKLLAGAQGQVTLKVYEGGHDFFLQPASLQARAAWRDAAEFFAARLN